MLSALLIRSPWVNKILDGSKTWEIRGRSVSKRGRIGLIESGTGTVVGVADLTDAIGSLTQRQFLDNARKLGLKRSEVRGRLPYPRGRSRG